MTVQFTDAYMGHLAMMSWQNVLDKSDEAIVYDTPCFSEYPLLLISNIFQVKIQG